MWRYRQTCNISMVYCRSMCVCVCMRVPICIPCATRAGWSSVDLYAEVSMMMSLPPSEILPMVFWESFHFSHPFKSLRALESLKLFPEDQPYKWTLLTAISHIVLDFVMDHNKILKQFIIFFIWVYFVTCLRVIKYNVLLFF